MKVAKVSAENHSCNFCTDGDLVPGKVEIIRPYEEVLEIEGRGVAFNVCPKCTADLQNKLEEVWL